MRQNYFKVSNHIIDHLARDLTPIEFKLFMVIIRKTVGWNRESDSIAITQFQELTGIQRIKTISAALNNLEAKKMIQVERYLGKINRYKLGALGATSGGKRHGSKAPVLPIKSTGGKRPTTKDNIKTGDSASNEQLNELAENLGLVKNKGETNMDFRLRIINEMSRRRFDAMQSE